MPRFDQWDQMREGPDPYEEAMQPAAPPAPPVLPPQEGGFGVPGGGAAPVEPTDFGTFEMPQYTGPYSPQVNVGPPPAFRPSKFGAPTLEQAQNEPGYQFRLQSGQGALESSAAARGVLRTGGTLKDLVTYGQNFGAQEYNNVFNRALQAYGAQYQAERDMYAPQFAQWQEQTEAQRQAALAAFQQQYNLWAQQGDWLQRGEDRTASTVLGATMPGDVTSHSFFR